MATSDERQEELETLTAIYPELVLDVDGPFSAQLEIPVSPAKPPIIRFAPSGSDRDGRSKSSAAAAANGHAYVERDVLLSHLPPLTLNIGLPDSYPTETIPRIRLTTRHDWLPPEILAQLERDVEMVWEECGRYQVLYSYIDHIQQAAERGFDIDQSPDGCLMLPDTAERQLVSFDAEAKLAIFNAGTYDCGICLEPKKGTSCYQLPACGHIFCKSCLQDFYNNAISEGDVVSIRCLDPNCGKDQDAVNDNAHRRKAGRTLHPRDLLAIGIEETKVRRYVELKRKKKLEADKNTIYCPRQWCQGPAKNPKYPPIPADLLLYSMDDSSDEDNAEPPTSPRVVSAKTAKPGRPTDSADTVAICEKCSLAFCRICFKGWHGAFVRCYPRDPNELSVEEKASYDYILANTSPCATCSAPIQKTMGCNHMKCFQCNTHFCYLCGAWLDVANPYQHFNNPGTPCYQRLWELEEGDEGQAPADGRGFGGGRAWERMAIEAAREAQAEEDARAALELEAQER